MGPVKVRTEEMTSVATAAALRILTAIHNRQQPDETDVAFLRAACFEFCTLPPDELAGTVLLAAIQRRMKKRILGIQDCASG